MLINIIFYNINIYISIYIHIQRMCMYVNIINGGMDGIENIPRSVVY